MDYKALQRLEALRKLNADPTWVNRDLFRLLYKPDLYAVAYEEIKSQPGNMTAGVDGMTLDGFSNDVIQDIIKKIQNESFQFKPAKRTYIPKTNGKMRPLGIPMVHAYCTPYQEPWGWIPCRWFDAGLVGHGLFTC